ncbi:hypothetical protein DBT52_09575 [Aerococcus mictus]|nr:hypothetical protein DBT52_09575 [Aerococcus mictus]
MGEIRGLSEGGGFTKCCGDNTDNPQEQGITVAPLNVEVRYRSAGARRKSYLFPTTKVSQVLVDYALNKFREQDGWFDGCKSVPILFFARGQDKCSNK